MATRRCMVCRLDLLKGFFKYRTDPICISCTADVREQRRLLQIKYKREDRAVMAARVGAEDE
jgi:hypothetical protein